MKYFKSSLSVLVVAVILCTSLTLGFMGFNNQPDYQEPSPLQKNVQVVSPDNSLAVEAPGVVSAGSEKTEDENNEFDIIHQSGELQEQTEPVSSVDENGNVLYLSDTVFYSLPEYYNNEIKTSDYQIISNPFNYNAGSFKYYEHLSDEGKAVYNIIISALKKDITVETIQYIPETEITGSTADEMMSKISTAVNTAYLAIAFDYPEYFWLNGIGISCSYYPGDVYTLIYANLIISYYSSYLPSNVQSYYDNLLTAVENFSVTGLNRFEKLKSIHDSLSYLVTYDPNYNNSLADPYAHQPTGALTCNNIAVCEGYAEAFKLICDREGIPCVLASGDNHMWNYVQMENGNWYMVDVTWDDQSSATQYAGIFYDYFLVGLGTSIPHFSNSSCADGHTEEFKIMRIRNGVEETLDYSSILSCPTLHTGDYANMYLLTSSDKLSVDETNKKIYLMPGGTTNNLLTKADVGTITRGGNKTGDTLTFTSTGGAATTYKVIMYGDVNCDGTVTASDYSLIKKAAAGSVSLGTYPFDAGDINRDSAVDAFDAFQLEMYFSGKKSYFEIAK